MPHGLRVGDGKPCRAVPFEITSPAAARSADASPSQMHTHFNGTRQLHWRLHGVADAPELLSAECRRFILNRMQDASHVSRILDSLDQSDPSVTERLLPLVYDELRRLASQKLAREQPGQTLQPTALVNEAYLRLVDVQHQQKWNSRGHFFAAAAEAMRRILVENARRKNRVKHGGELRRREFDDAQFTAPDVDLDLLALNEALDRLAATDGSAAQLVKLRYFTGLTVPQAAEAMGVSTRTAERLWTYAKAWLFREIRGD